MTNSPQFVPFVLFVDGAFWSELNRRKLNDWRLDESPRSILAAFTNYDAAGGESRLCVSHDSFEEKRRLPRGACQVKGRLLMLNTIEAFKGLDRKLLLQESAAEIFEVIRSGAWMHDPSVLNTFIFTVYGDLKHYRYQYWNCVPALCHPHSMCLRRPTTVFSDVDVVHSCAEFSRDLPHHVFLLIKNKAMPITELAKPDLVENDVILVIRDSSPQEQHPGWPLRNLLAAVAYTKYPCPPLHSRNGALYFRLTWHGVRVLCYRTGPVPSILLDIGWEGVVDALDREKCPASVGWERNGDKLAAREVDVSSSLDPVKSMKESVELNLRLIRWRLVPGLRIELFAGQRCLILGSDGYIPVSGTLGCSIARALLGWGVRRFTFVDNCLVSFSNPVRQSLFEFADAVDGKSKAQAAADSLARIYPAVEASAVNLCVPMPGHTVPDSEVDTVRGDIECLDRLVREHDVLFLVMDSRESRWLPTLLAATHNKMALSVALGFDSYVVIRHGIAADCPQPPRRAPDLSHALNVAGCDLACYFCNDVTAPGDSSRDRTLDQQCTVSRAGLSQIAAGTAVELFASVLQHDDGAMAPAPIGELEDGIGGVLGATPHQIRGFLSRFHQMTPTVRRFDQCVACGSAVRSRWTNEGWRFVVMVMNNPGLLENVAGLRELQDAADRIDLWEFDDNDSVCSTSANC